MDHLSPHPHAGAGKGQTRPSNEIAEETMKRRSFLAAGATALAMALGPAAFAQETLKIGLILPLTGPFASTGRQIEAAARLYMQQNGDTAGGKKIQLIVRDDT